MKNLITKFNKLEGLDKGGIIFIATFLVPVIVALISDLAKNGSNLL